MADQLQPSGNAADQDTRTRKTVRLHTVQPAIPEPPKTETIIRDPLTARDTDTGNLEILSDTQTRRTLKLKPIAPGANPAVQLNITQGNNDTATRKTVLLKPVSPASTAVQAPATPAPAAPKTIPMPPGMAGKKAPTVVLATSPVIPAAAAPQNTALKPPTVVLSSSPLASAKSDQPAEETAAVPRPSIKPAVSIPKPAAAIPKPAVAAPQAADTTPAPAEEPDSTSAVPRPAAEPAEEEDQTVKLKRPLRLAPPPVPAASPEIQKATVKLPPPKLPPMGLKPPTPVSPAPTPTPSVQTATLKKPPVPQAVSKAPEPVSKPVPPPSPAPVEPVAVVPPKEEEKPEKESPEEKKAPNPIEEPETIELISGIKQEQEKEQRQNAKGKKAPPSGITEMSYTQQPSVFYLALTAAALIFVIASSAISAVQYLDFCHGKKFYDAVPGLPIAK